MTNKIADSVVLITSNDSDNSSFGSGFVVMHDENGAFVVSCAHVVRDIGGTGKVKVKDLQAYIIASGSEDGPDDLVLLYVEHLLNAPALNLATTGRKGDDVNIAGFQLFTSQHLCRPLKAKLGDEVFFEAKRPIERVKAWDLIVLEGLALERGHSGSPVVDQKSGHVMGIVNYRQGGGKKGLAICIETLRKIGIPFELLKQIFHDNKLMQKEEKRSKQYIVGRKEEISLLRKVVSGELPPILNIYGPGGIGKTVICEKFEQWCKKNKTTYATVKGNEPSASTINQILSLFVRRLENNAPKNAIGDVFEEFVVQLTDYKKVIKLVGVSDGIDQMFDLAGNPQYRKNETWFDIPKERSEHIEKLFSHRMSLERYIGGINSELTDFFLKGITHMAEKGNTKIVLMVDTYEGLEGLDGWICETFVKRLPIAVKVIIFGRDKLSRKNQDWIQYGEENLFYHELRELSEKDAKKYFRHHGLQDEESLNRVYEFTRGYPLCLVLAVDLAKDLNGWEQVRNFKDTAFGDRVASQLLERILRQQQVEEVKDFLEKGVVTEWFDPGLISYLLDINPQRGREIYDKISKFSFVHQHPKGLQFHDTVRAMLELRFKHTYGDERYRHLLSMCRDYIKIRAGVI